MYPIQSNDGVIAKNPGCLSCPLTVIRIRSLDFRHANSFIDFYAPYPFVVCYGEDQSLGFAEHLGRHFVGDQMTDVPSLVWHSGSEHASLFGRTLRATGSIRFDGR